MAALAGKTFGTILPLWSHFMEFMSAAWWSALLAIILIDLVLAGDNAIVIALAARNLPKEHQRKAIIWGTVGAIVVRSAMTLVVVWLLRIPGLMAVGGIALMWIAYKLIAEEEGGGEEPSGVR
jgi:YjbE family integral membrane protein